MHLHDCLRELATALNLDADHLVIYATEDNIGGRDTLQGRYALPGAVTDFSGMSVFAAEGKILYALVRALKPDTVVEIGVDAGCSSYHILAAMETNQRGHLHSVDIATEGIGREVPERLRHRWTLQTGVDGLTASLPGNADICFEDANHLYQPTVDTLTRLKSLNPRLMLSHDAVTHLTYGEGGFQVLPAFRDVLGTDRYVLPDGSIAGLAYWVNEDYQNE